MSTFYRSPDLTFMCQDLGQALQAIDNRVVPRIDWIMNHASGQNIKICHFGSYCRDSKECKGKWIFLGSDQPRNDKPPNLGVAIKLVSEVISKEPIRHKLALLLKYHPIAFVQRPTQSLEEFEKSLVVFRDWITRL